MAGNDVFVNFIVNVVNRGMVTALRGQEREMARVDDRSKKMERSAKDLTAAENEQTAATKKQTGVLGGLSNVLERNAAQAEKSRKATEAHTAAQKNEELATLRLTKAQAELASVRERNALTVKKTTSTDLDLVRAAEREATALYRVARAQTEVDKRHRIVIQSTTELGDRSTAAGKAMDFLGSKTHILAQKFRDLGTILKGFKWPVIVGGLFTAAGAVSALAAGFVALLPAVARAASSVLSLVGPLTRAAGALLSVVGPLSQVAGLAAALPAALIGLAAAAGSVALAFSGVGAALKAAVASQQQVGAAAVASAQQQRSAALQVEQAERSLVSAQLAVTDSLKAVTDAQNALHDARQQAVRDLNDMRSAEAHGELAVKEAKISLARARQDLQELVLGGGDPSSLAYREAVLRVQEAQLGVSDARRQNKRNQNDLDEAEKKGVTQADIVVNAQEQLANAYRSVQDAIQGVKDAEESLRSARISMAQGTSAAQNLSTAMAQLSPPAQAFVKALAGMYPLLKKLKETAATGVFTPVLDVFGRLKTLFPVINRAVEATSKVMGNLIAKFIELVTSPAWRRDIGSIFAGNIRPLRLAGDAILNFLDAMRNVTVEAQPLVQWIARLIHGWSETAKRSAEAARESGRLADFFDRVRDVATILGHTIRNLARVIFGFFKAGHDTGMTLLRTFEDLTARWADWVNSIGTQNRLRDWFDEARQSMETVGHILANLGRVIIDFFRAGTSTGDEMLTSLSDITDKWAEFLHKTSTQNKLAAWFEKARDDGRLLLDVLGHLFRGLMNIFQAADETGHILWERIDAAAKRFEEFTGSVEGQNKLKQWFQDALPVLHEAALLFRAILRSIGRLAQDQERGLVPLLVSIRTKLLPGLEKFLGFLSKVFQDIAPGTIEALSEVLGLIFQFLAKTSTLLPLVVQLFKAFVDAVIALTKIPGLGQVVVLLLSLGAGLRLAFAIGKFTGITWLISKVGVLTNAIKGLVIWLAGMGGAAGTLAKGLRAGGKVIGAAGVAFSAFEANKLAREGNTAGGIAAGVAGGALAGSAFGPAGAVIGGAVGFASGLGGAIDRRDEQATIKMVENAAKALQHQYEIGAISADEFRARISAINEKTADFTGGLVINANALIDQSDAAKEASDKNENLSRSTGQLANETQHAASQHTQMAEALRREAEASAAFRKVLDKNRDGLNAYARITGRTTSSIIADLQEARRKGPQAVDAMTDQMVLDVTQWQQDTTAQFDVAEGALDEFVGKAKVTPKEIQASLDETAENLKNYGEDWKTVTQKAGGQYTEFVDHLRSLGPDAAGLISGLADANQQDFNRIARTWEKTKDKSATLADQITGPLVDAMHKLINSIRTANNLKPIDWDKLINKQKARQNMVEAWRAMVNTLRQEQKKHPLPQPVLNVLLNKKLIGTQVQDMVQETKNKLLIRSPSKVFKDIGMNMGLGLSEGWDAHWGPWTDKALTAIDTFLTKVADSIKRGTDPIVAAVEDAVNQIASIWTRLKGVFEEPVRYVVNTVLGGLMKAFNTVLEYLGKDPLTVSTYSGGGAVGGRADTPQTLATGGFVPGEGDRDTVPALLTPGEFVIRKRSAEKIGYGNLQRLNRMAAGGAVGAQDTGSAPGDAGPTVGSAEVAAAGGPEAFLTREFDAIKDGMQSNVPYLQTLRALTTGTMDEAVKWAGKQAILGGGIPAGTGPFYVFPVEKPYSYGDGFGAPRYAGGYHPHAGNDILADLGKRVFAPFPGSVSAVPNTLGGNAIHLTGALGYIYGAHLSKYGKMGPVSVGEVIGYVGNTGDAQGGPTHLHFEWHPKSIPANPYRSAYGYTVINGAIDPFPYLQAVEAAQAAADAGGPGGGVGPTPKPTGQVADWLAEAARLRGESDVDGWVRRMLPIAYHESRYLPGAYNDTPVSSGQHAAGLMQMIGSTYSNYRMSGRPAVATYTKPPPTSDIFNPVLNAFSALGLLKDPHGWHYPSDPGGPPFAKGGLVKKFGQGGMVGPSWSPGAGFDFPSMATPRMSMTGLGTMSTPGTHPALDDSRAMESPIDIRLELDGRSIIQSTRTHDRRLRVTMAGRP